MAITTFVPNVEVLAPQPEPDDNAGSDASALNYAQGETFALLKVLLLGMMERQAEYDEALWELSRDVDDDYGVGQDNTDQSKDALEHAIENLAAVLTTLPAQDKPSVISLNTSVSAENPLFCPMEEVETQEADDHVVGEEEEQAKREHESLMQFLNT
jgi:hypothetical protein